MTKEATIILFVKTNKTWLVSIKSLTLKNSADLLNQDYVGVF